MNHSIYGKKLSRSSDERKRLVKNLLKSLITHGTIKTSKAKAQAIRPTIDKLITKAKRNTAFSKRMILAELSDKESTKKLIEMAETRFTARNSGYTRMIKIGKRLGDASEQVILTFVDEEIKTEVLTPVKTEAKKQKTDKTQGKEIKEKVSTAKAVKQLKKVQPKVKKTDK